MFKEMKLSTKFGLALAPLVVAAFVLLAFVLGADGDSRPSLAWIWIAIALPAFVALLVPFGLWAIALGLTWRTHRSRTL